MLIVHRRAGERIVLDGGIEITVTATTSRGVRLAVKAPRGVTVLRGEVHDAIVAANAAAAEVVAAAPVPEQQDAEDGREDGRDAP